MPRNLSITPIFESKFQKIFSQSLLITKQIPFSKISTERDANGCSTGSELKEETMFHITPKGNLAVNGELTGDDLESSQKDYCVEAHIRKN